MEIFLVILVLLAIIGISNILNRFVPFIPVPLFQIALGMAVVVIPPGIHMTLNSELFLVLFIAPLLFNDGKRTPRHELWNLRAPILMLALGLVFATVLVVGYLIHWMIPSIPLPAAFALAAILSPTDAVAVGAMAGRANLPKKIMHLLEGEALINDASGLVAFKFAVAAMVTGVFSLGNATFSFFVIAVGGLVVGAVVSLFIIWLRVFLRRHGMEDITMHMLIQLLTPFVIYLIAEEFGLSGILAVVAGGVVHAIERDRTESSSNLKLRIVSESTWSIVLYILNGLVFVILGLQIPDVTSVIFENRSISNFLVIGYILLLTAALILLRFVWVYLYSRGSWAVRKKDELEKPTLLAAVLTSLSGVRGAVTLAGAFSMPLVLQDGSPFPQRDLIIFIAAGVILLTLIIASITLPLLSKSEKGDEEENPDALEQASKIKVLKAAIQGIRGEINEENEAAALSVISDYKKKIEQLLGQEALQNTDSKSRQLLFDVRLVGIQAERDEMERLLSKKEVAQEVADRFQEIIDQMEVLLSQRLKMRLLVSMFRIRRLILNMVHSEKAKVTDSQDPTESLKEVSILTAKAAITAIHNRKNETNRDASLLVISQYHRTIERLSSRECKQFKEDEEFKKHRVELQFKAIQIERDEVQDMFESGEISRTAANQLRQFINYLEAGMLDVEEL
ncbi:Na+/H+ antiporter [Paenibacillus macquariensis]|uniref:Sodium/proton antiporter, CPA1 family n=1 Tax=Paenibacillus macquariensis TaxID=948756 RepID=A0ABY1K1P4_9BACL|nr:Na+/H+ antiporter [Paenibacillus macquariensis]MEC0091715.1 Na+/H+ antiporter [Paenibacillus macquariensis]OAB32359.1 Na+/H+ antiporter [Paenibacillus macquariensis subsp. macquariensis]SIR13437.1 sodium/proton antiporter, CPA1 family [Paenibacillus macquariensis]